MKTLLPFAVSMIFASACAPKTAAPRNNGSQTAETAADKTESSASDPVASTEQFRVVPVAIRYDEETQTVFVQAQVKYEGAPVGHSREAYMGVTLGAADGEEFDLAVQTVFSENLDQPLLFSAGVEKPIEDVLIGLWDRKIEPCDSDRPGCKEYGFLLDGSLATWPPELYTNFERQRILPHVVSLQWFGENDGSWAEIQTTLGGWLSRELEVFGSTLEIKHVETATPPEGSGVRVLHRHPKDKIFAKSLAGALQEAAGTPASVQRVENLSTVFAVVVETASP